MPRKRTCAIDLAQSRRLAAEEFEQFGVHIKIRANATIKFVHIQLATVLSFAM
jgi:hypothetical protein